jgi:guanyl-specific ribonuclease Sa
MTAALGKQIYDGIEGKRPPSEFDSWRLGGSSLLAAIVIGASEAGVASRLITIAKEKGGGSTGGESGTSGEGRKLPFNDAERSTGINNTLDLIESGGPFPHKKDGTVFKNKEGKLPDGNYLEYTVDTPGASSRGTRRIVKDADSGRVYYTDDHYENFIQIDPTKRSP